MVNFSDSASIDPHRVDVVIAGHKDAEMIGLEGVFSRARSVAETLKKHWHQSVTGWSVHSQACRTHTDQPFLWCPAGQADVQRSTPDQADLLRGRISADYALLSPCVRRYGYGAPQRRVCDESFACYLLREPTW